MSETQTQPQADDRDVKFAVYDMTFERYTGDPHPTQAAADAAVKDLVAASSKAEPRSRRRKAGDFRVDELQK